MEEMSQMADHQALPVDQNGRGRRIQLVFTMQGMGIWFQTITMMILLLVSGQANADEDTYNAQVLTNVWRISYFVASAILVYVCVSRYLYLEESEIWAYDQEQRVQKTREEEANALSNVRFGNTQSPIKVLFREYGVRLSACATSWFLWDISFYGNKLFQPSFILAVAGENISLFDYTLVSVMTSTAALVGYVGAAFLIDHPQVGRLRLQSIGFLVTSIIFLLCAFAVGSMKSSVLVAMYLLSSFFGQLGPNATTFLVGLRRILESIVSFATLN